MSAPHPLDAVREDDLRRLARARAPLDRIAGSRARGGPARATRAGAGLEYREHRPYRPGDDLRRLDWRVSTRRAHPYVRTFDEERANDWVVCLDHSASMSRPDPRRWHLAIQLCVVMAYLLLDGGGRVGLALFGPRPESWCPPGSGRLQYLRLARRLREITNPQARGAADLGALARLVPPRCHAMIISDFLAEDAMTGGLTALQRPRRRLQLLQITSPADADAGSATVLEDAESGRRLVVREGAAQAARLALAAHHATLSRYCLGAGVGLGRCHSGQPWKHALTGILGPADD